MTVLFVCSGNICRSPLAEALCRKQHPDWDVFSRGIWADTGFAATIHSQNYAKEYGADLSDHIAADLTHDDMERADCVYGMTAQHVAQMQRTYPEFREKISMLPCGEVDDPYGHPAEVYRDMAKVLWETLKEIS